jgi:DNA-binding FrmR family transcriptional regulator
MSTDVTRGYTASRDELKARLKKIEGQVRGVERMIDDDRYCIEILTQIAAVQAALDKVALGLLDGHVAHCVVGGHGPGTDEERTTELMSAVGRLLRR